MAKKSINAFALAVSFVLAKEIEGGYVNDPRDPGGETNFGISKRAYPDLDIRGLTEDDARAIYKRDYWDTVRGDSLPPIIAVAVFDAAVNQGRNPAIQLLQRAVGVEADGKLGPVTLKAIHDADPEELLVEYLGWRARRYHGTVNADVYIRGWMIRLFRLQAFALETFGANAKEAA
jgi:lysozyme family protein